MSNRTLPPRDRPAVPIVPFMDLPGVSADPMIFVDHLKSYNHDVSQEVPQTFFLVGDDDLIRQVMFYQVYSPGATDQAIRKIVSGTLPQAAFKITAVVMFAESWSNCDSEVLERQARGEVFSLEGLPGTYDQISLILDSPTIQGMWTNRLVGNIPNRSLGQWEEMKEMRFKRFANYFPESRN